MLKNLLKTGLRHLWKHRFYTSLNVLGLTVGLSALFLLLVFSQFEYGFDQFHSAPERTFRVIQTFNTADGEQDRVNTSLHLADMLQEQFPAVEAAANYVGGASGWVKQGEKRIFEENFYVASERFFEVFDFPLTAGQPQQVLSQPYSVVVSTAQAEKYFGTTDVVGQQLDFERYGVFTITGVIEAVPAQSSLQFDMVLTQDFDYYLTQVAPWFPDWFQSWQGTPARTYLKLSSTQEKEAFESQLNGIIANYKGVDWEPQAYSLQALSDQHFSETPVFGQLSSTVVGQERRVKMFAAIALFILLLAGINFVNMSTAYAGRRAKEIGLRKVAGAKRYHLVVQFLGETALTVGLAMIGMLVLLSGAWPLFESFTGVSFISAPGFLLSVAQWFGLASVLLIVLAGAYPAFYLSRYEPRKALKDHQLQVTGNERIRQGLVGFQFFMVVALISSLLLMEKQYAYMAGSDLGFEQDNLMVIEVNGGGVRTNFEQIKTSLLEHPAISDVTGFTRVVSGDREPQNVAVSGDANAEDPWSMDFYGMDEDGLSTMSLQLQAGANFSGFPLQDSTKVLINETAARMLGESAIGQRVNINNELTAEVIGVVEDFHYRSLHEPIRPLVIGYLRNPIESLDDIVVRVAATDLSPVIAYAEEVHNRYDENQVITLRFLDEVIGQFYAAEQRTQQLFRFGSLIALLLAILGIIGLSSYLLQVKAKDYSVRRILGAAWGDLLKLQLRPYLLPLTVGGGLAILLISYGLQQWLQQYAYRVEFTYSPMVFVFALLIVITAALVFSLSWKYLRTNPVEAIRND